MANLGILATTFLKHFRKCNRGMTPVPERRSANFPKCLPVARHKSSLQLDVKIDKSAVCFWLAVNGKGFADVFPMQQTASSTARRVVNEAIIC